MNNASLMRRVMDLLDAHDFENSAPLFHEDCEIVDMASGEVFRGHDGLKNLMEGWLVSFPDNRVEMTDLVTGEDRAVVEFICRATHTGPLQGPNGVIARTGKRVEVNFLEIFRIRAGKVEGTRCYSDFANVLARLASDTELVS